MEAHTVTSKKTWWWVVSIVLLALFLLKAAWLPSWVRGGSYQAVFLTNNQVYFGKLSSRTSAFPVLRDIYYLRVTQTLQPTDLAATASGFQLAKLGDELHGPKDAMSINRDHILFIEDLRSDSQVVGAIRAYHDTRKVAK